MFKSEVSFPVYCHECWWSDKWDPLKFGREYDFSIPFFEQFAMLQKETPRPALYSSQNINSQYCNHTAHNKNCYLMFGSWFSENCGYGNTVLESKDCWDCLFVEKCEACLHTVDSTKSYQLHFSQNCTACTDSAFLYDCKNCQNCLFSYNLRNKNYHVFNQPVSKEEFARIKNETFGSYSVLQKKFSEFRKVVQEKALHKYLVGEHNKDVSGNFIYNAKNVRASFFISGGENEKYAVRSVKAQKDSMDIFGVNGGELGYESNNVDFSSRCYFGVNGENNARTDYLVDCFNVENSFGCTSLRAKKYCILNKQHDEKTYSEMRDKIIAQMENQPYVDKIGRKYSYGEFFPPELSPFAYNETIAQEYAPLTKKQAEKLGFPWQDTSDKNYAATKRWDELPDSISKTDDSVLKENILCEAWDKNKELAKEHQCTKAFRITPDELEVYRKFGLPLPRKCPNTRNFEKFQMRNPVALWHRQCVCDYTAYPNSAKHLHHPTGRCPNEFETSYSPERPEIVYCEQCYQQEVA